MIDFSIARLTGHDYTGGHVMGTPPSVYPQVAMAAAEKTAALLFGEADQAEPGKLLSLRS
ncbi:hypothetical protein [Nonomuraea sp. JJY05]|uniref:hypothetical protein n=1 Tax=Nonomuraea sp. JJY05 TaxID=3350255 RepID=UPI00373F36D1